ncbi:hypothetical protein KSS87_016255 [Heliosperma pusillum]|nr:hypothetical protein KSS87_016255 [Heliosperma pusillum]
MNYNPNSITVSMHVLLSLVLRPLPSSRA